MSTENLITVNNRMNWRETQYIVVFAISKLQWINFSNCLQNQISEEIVYMWCFLPLQEESKADTYGHVINAQRNWISLLWTELFRTYTQKKWQNKPPIWKISSAKWILSGVSGLTTVTSRPWIATSGRLKCESADMAAMLAASIKFPSWFNTWTSTRICQTCQ